MTSKPPVHKDSKFSYTYWVGKPGDAAEAPAPPPVPQKLSQEDLVTLQKSNSQGSLWNQAGTWEEKTLSDWARERIQEKLKFSETVVLQRASEKFEINVKSCTGDATIVIVRNKRRHGYTFELKLGFKGTCSKSFKQSREVSGSINISEVSMGELDELEVEVKVNDKSSLTQDKTASVVKAVQSLVPSIRARLQEFEAEFKER